MGLPITITADPSRWHIRVGDTILGETSAALMLSEAGHSPTLYVPRADMAMEAFTPTDRITTCPWKGQASYLSVAGLQNVVWSYVTPQDRVAAIAGYLAFYPQVTVERVD